MANAPAAPAVAVTNPRRVKALELGIELSIDESGSASSGRSDLRDRIRAWFRRVGFKLWVVRDCVCRSAAPDVTAPRESTALWRDCRSASILR
jgi:hypothetical protein